MKTNFTFFLRALISVLLCICIITANTSAQNGFTATYALSNAAVNLTTLGTSDWKHFRVNDKKASGIMINAISNYSAIGSTAFPYDDDARKFSWTDGTPTISSLNNQNGLYVVGVGKGFTYTVKPGIGSNTLYLYFGGYNSGATLTVHSSNANVADYTNTTSNYANEWDALYTINYATEQANETITITWKQAAGTGNVTIQAAAFVNAPILPVNFLSVTAAQKDTYVAVEWVTSKEINNDHFEIERSNNGATFAPIGEMAPGSAANKYFFKDIKPKSGNNFYRIKSIDKDGKWLFSKTVATAFKSAFISDIMVYPNPAVTYVIIDLKNNLSDEQAQVEVMDVSGKRVYMSAKRSNINTFQLNTSNYAKGTYLIKITRGSEKSSKKLVIR